MKIFLITENYHAGGMDSFIVHLLNNWPQNDQFFLVCNYDHPGLNLLKDKLRVSCTILTHRLLLRGRYYYKYQNSIIWRYILRPIFSFIQYFIFIYHFIYFRKLLSHHLPDKVLIVAGNYPGGETPRAAALVGFLKPIDQKPFFIYHNNPSQIRKFFFFPETALDFIIEKSVKSFITVSNYTRDAMKIRPILNRSTKHKVIHNGIDTPPELPNSQDLQKILGQIPEFAPVLLMLGTYEIRKGHEFLLEAFVQIFTIFPETRLIIAGSGYYNDKIRIETLIDKYNLNNSVFLLDFQKNIFHLLKRTTVLVVPSQEFESFGLTIIEAFSLKIPVVATQVGGIPEVLVDGIGGYTAPLDTRLFAKKIIELLQDQNLRLRVAEKGNIRYVEYFNAKRMANEYNKLLQKT